MTGGGARTSAFRRGVDPTTPDGDFFLPVRHGRALAAFSLLIVNRYSMDPSALKTLSTLCSPIKAVDPNFNPLTDIISNMRWKQARSGRVGRSSFLGRTVLCGCGPGEARPAPTQNSYYVRGENVGVSPRCGPVRRRGTTEFYPLIRANLSMWT